MNNYKIQQQQQSSTQISLSHFVLYNTNN